MLLQSTFRGRYNVMDDDGTLLGEFEIEHYSETISSIHTKLKPEFIGKGFGRQMYDEAEKILGEMGRKLVPSPSLSPYSLKFWQKRAPHLLKHHQRPSFNGGLEADRRLYVDFDPDPERATG